MKTYRAVALVLAALASSGPALADEPAALPAAAQAAFAPPLGQPMLLSRTVIRELPDGARIVATRRWQVRFERSEGGYRVVGALAHSEIAAPPSLMQLADLERTRPDDLLPLVLDGSGRILSEGGVTGQDGRAAVGDALKLVEAMLAQRPSAEGPAQDAAFLARLRVAAAAPLSAHWPAQLFVAAAPERVDRTFALPDGGQGRFVSDVVKQAGAGGLTATAERRIVTTIAGQDSVSTERWKLSPAG